MNEDTQSTTLRKDADGVPPLEDRNAAWERALLAQFLAPYEAALPTMTPEERRRVRAQVQIQVSLTMAVPEACAAYVSRLASHRHVGGYGGLL